MDGGAEQRSHRPSHCTWGGRRGPAGWARMDLGRRKVVVTHGDNRLQGLAGPFQIMFFPYFVPLLIQNTDLYCIKDTEMTVHLQGSKSALCIPLPEHTLQHQSGSITRLMANHPRSFNYLNCKACHFAFGIKAFPLTLIFQVLSKKHRESNSVMTSSPPYNKL